MTGLRITPILEILRMPPVGTDDNLGASKKIVIAFCGREDRKYNLVVGDV